MSIVSPEIVSESVDSNRAEFDIRVPPELVFLQGHFPGEPVLPGVVQVHWAIELASERFDLRPDFEAIEGLKFHRVIEPGAEGLGGPRAITAPRQRRGVGEPGTDEPGREIDRGRSTERPDRSLASAVRVWLLAQAQTVDA